MAARKHKHSHVATVRATTCGHYNYSRALTISASVPNVEFCIHPASVPVSASVFVPASRIAHPHPYLYQCSALFSDICISVRIKYPHLVLCTNTNVRVCFVYALCCSRPCPYSALRVNLCVDIRVPRLVPASIPVSALCIKCKCTFPHPYPYPDYIRILRPCPYLYPSSAVIFIFIYGVRSARVPHPMCVSVSWYVYMSVSDVYRCQYPRS